MSDLFNRRVISSFSGEYAFLSNFWMSPVIFNGEEFPSSEHAYQAAKCADVDEYNLFKNPSMTPGQAKRLGRKVVIWSNWEDIKFDRMQRIVESKFEDIHLWALLQATGDAILIEGNNWGDRYWGECEGVGENNLGLILMHCRDRPR